ncbi:MAG: hypothetical protein AAFQ63_13190 [Cyanobacteria bacterium J06621_11]
MSTNSISTLLSSESIQPQKGRISFGFVTGQDEVSELVKENVRYIFSELLAPLVAVRFVEHTGEADINFQLHDFDEYYAYELENDVFLQRGYDNSRDQNGFQSGLGSHGFMSLMHEILHTLGFKHPGNYNDNGLDRGPFLPYDLDNTTNTVLSYNFAGSGAASLMPYDILAMRFVYGARGLNRGRTTYSFSSVHSFTDGKRTWGDSSSTSKLTLIDDGGFDVLDFSGLKAEASGYVLDARVGGIFTTGEAHNTATYTPVDRLASKTEEQTTSFYGTRLGFKTVIESIIGSQSDDLIVAGKRTRTVEAGAGNDTVYGRALQNIILGGAGDDYIIGGRQNDQLIGGNDDDILYGDEGRDLLIGEAGDDTLYGQGSSDRLLGGDGNDVLFGTDGGLKWEKDELTGDAGRDRFVLGTTDDVFYQGKGHAVITDFETGSDQIQLSLGSDQYTLKVRNFGGNAALDTGIYYKNNLIAVAENSIIETFDSRDFVFV